MRKLALDVGDMRIGLALSDPLGIIASPLETYTRVSWEADVSYISSLVKAQSVDTIVVGLPLNMDGTSGERVEKTKLFASKLEAIEGVKIVFQDERLSTVEAERALKEGNLSLEKRKAAVDKIAAQIILRAYLAKQ